MEYPREQIELGGASGKRYRFRRVIDLNLLPATGGHFVYLKHTDSEASVIACGASETLIKARDFWPKLQAEHGADSIYIRLSISRTSRLEEYEDIAQAQPSASKMNL